MGLEDFEKELAATKAEEGSTRKRHRSRSRSRDRHRDKDRHHRSSRHKDDHRSSRHKDDNRSSRHKDDNPSSRHKDDNPSSRHKDDNPSSRHKDDKDDRDDRDRPSRRHHHHRSSRHDGDAEGDDNRERKRRRSTSPRKATPRHEKVEESQQGDSDDADDWVEREAMTAPPTEEILDQRHVPEPDVRPARDSWMEAPSSINIDYVQKSRVRKSPPSQFVPAKEQHERKIHKHEVDQLIRDLEESGDDLPEEEVVVLDEPAQHDVDYTFGDSGSQWRMTKLRGVYRKAEESRITVEEAALKAYGDLRGFDDAREEERELDRRSMYGKDYIGLEKPSGELFQERKQNAGIPRNESSIAHGHQEQGASSTAANAQRMDELSPPTRTVPLDSTALNKLKAQLMKAKLRKAPNLAQLEAEYEAAAAANSAQPDVVVLNAVENRMLAGGREGEVINIDNKRGRERGHVVENEDMSIEDMVRQEKRTRGQFGGEGRAFAERIAKDGKFTDNLDYMDENAAKLAKNIAKSNINLRNTAVGDFQKMQKILDSCPLCHHENTNTPPAAPIVSLATRVYMTLTTEPEVAVGGAVIVPIQHHLNLLECDDDEWEEIRNFMKSLTRMYHQRDKGVIFYENAAHMHSRKGHAAMFAVPVPFHLADNAPAYFKEAVLSSDEEWSQHKKVIDTLANSQKPGYGKQAFRKSLVKEMAYFHVWFTMDGGLGHVIEDERRWPKGDLFAREIVGGMLGKGPEVVKKQGRWTRQDARVEGFRKRWNPFDWTSVLMDAQ